ncbi:MAG: hydroxyacylglutathione hydrolase [Planktotalea sp.]|uniref:hydroxyacylglutathione hydrolase n=1 Tax=Planktotalea sp. TaxID=2029877 RepID=UPI003C711A50
MPYEIVTIPCLADNYAFLIGNIETREAAIVDVPEAGPINAEVTARGWTLTTVLLTHHHWDHIDGLDGLTGREGLNVIGAAADAHRLPPLSQAVSEGDAVNVLGITTHIYDVSGHTLGHIAFHMPELDAVFTADSLMALGCGRLFEGTPGQMHQSLSKLAAMPEETVVYSGHEYTTTNAKFALTIEPDNAALISRCEATETARAAGTPTVPSSLKLERATNPFLRAHIPQIARHLGMQGASEVDVFTEIRKRRDSF